MNVKTNRGAHSGNCNCRCQKPMFISICELEFISRVFVFVTCDRYTFRHYAAAERRLDAPYIICDLKPSSTIQLRALRFIRACNGCLDDNSHNQSRIRSSAIRLFTTLARHSVSRRDLPSKKRTMRERAFYLWMPLQHVREYIFSARKTFRKFNS